MLKYTIIDAEQNRELTHLKITVLAFRPASVFSSVTLGNAVKEVAVIVTGAVLLKYVSHFGLEKSHVHIYSHHLTSKKQQ